LEKTLKEIADYTLFNLILALEELWNYSRYQDNGILKEYVKIAGLTVFHCPGIFCGSIALQILV
jgi:hypothetical protein